MESPPFPVRDKGPDVLCRAKICKNALAPIYINYIFINRRCQLFLRQNTRMGMGSGGTYRVARLKCIAASGRFSGPAARNAQNRDHPPSVGEGE